MQRSLDKAFFLFYQYIGLYDSYLSVFLGYEYQFVPIILTVCVIREKDDISADTHPHACLDGHQQLFVNFRSPSNILHLL